MNKGNLSDYFEGVAVKTLSKVDANPLNSNQHEIGTTKKMREDFLGSEDCKFITTFIYFDTDEQAISDTGFSTHYDTRKNKPNRRPEWRLYYPTNAVTDLMNDGDSLFLAKQRNKASLLFVVTPRGSTQEKQLLWLFGLQRPADKFASTYFDEHESQLSFSSQIILDELGIIVQEDDGSELDSILERIDFKLPKTSVFSQLARATAPTTDPIEFPDEALVTWLEHEEALFRRLERIELEKRIRIGFFDKGVADIDGFLAFSLSIQNRRKSRMGQSFEHHLSAIFEHAGLTFERGATTEHGNKPDFLFPGSKAYKKYPSGSPKLVMLGAKSTCKDRWRQVLREADKIPFKHLATLQPAISNAQTDQMKANKLQLVLPKPIHKTYTPDQQNWLISLKAFIEETMRTQLSQTS